MLPEAHVVANKRGRHNSDARPGWITVWLIILVEGLWLLGCAIVGRFTHVRATAGRIRSMLETWLPPAAGGRELRDTAGLATSSTAAAVEQSPLARNREAVVDFLKQNALRTYCDGCLSQALALDPVDTTVTTINLADTADHRVEVRMGWCSNCRRRKRVSQSPSVANRRPSTPR